MCEHFVLSAHVESECCEVRNLVAKAANFQLHVNLIIQVCSLTVEQSQEVQGNAIRMGIAKLLA
jgi:hypothetical protein